MQYHLKTPVEITIKGEFENSEFLNIEDPNRGNIKDVSRIMEIATSALVGVQKSVTAQADDSARQEEDEAMDGSQAVMILKLGGKYSESIEEFDKLLLKYGTFDDAKVQASTLNKMDLVDYNGALGEYFANFCFSEFIQD